MMSEGHSWLQSVRPVNMGKGSSGMVDVNASDDWDDSGALERERGRG